MTNTIIMILSALGSIFILIAAIGILRMPDFYLRLSVTIKAATLGIGCLLGSAAIYFNEFSVTTKVFAIIFFLFLTAPVAGHIISRTAYKIGIPLWKFSVLDELKGKYDNRKNRVESSFSIEKTKLSADEEEVSDQEKKEDNN